MYRSAAALLTLCIFVVTANCGNNSPNWSSVDGGTDSDTDIDTDSDTDSDTDTDTGPDPDGGSDTDVDTDTDSDAQCTEIHTIHYDWSTAAVVLPMETGISDTRNPFTYIFTTGAQDGEAEFLFSLPCVDDWYIWGAGLTPQGLGDIPRTFHASVNQLPPHEWELDISLTSSEWTWNKGRSEDIGDWILHLGPGDHTFKVGGGASFIGMRPKLGTIVFTNDPGLEP